MSLDKAVVIKASEVKSKLAIAWRETVDTGGPLVGTTGGVPDFVIYPLKEPVRMIHEDELMGFARQAYYPLANREGPPAGYENTMPRIGPDDLRREPGEQKMRMHLLMTPFAYTYYHQIVGILFPIPYLEPFEFVKSLDKALRPENYKDDRDDQA